MQTDMHYYGTFCIARAAGFAPDAALEAALAAILVDDCPTISQDTFKDGAFPSKAMFLHHATGHHPIDKRNLDAEDQRYVWVPFHFLPGGQGSSLEEKLICVKNSTIAQDMLRQTLHNEARQPWAAAAAGVAGHVYCDTFSHYGFSGISSQYNDIDQHSIAYPDVAPGMADYIKQKAAQFFANLQGDVSELASHLGHGAAATFPDRPYLRWSFRYERPSPVQQTMAQRDNQSTFMEAAQHLHAFFVDYVAAADGTLGDAGKALPFSEIKATVAEIFAFEGKLEERSAKWLAAAKAGVFGRQPEEIPPYTEDWATDAINVMGTHPDSVAGRQLQRFCAAAAKHRHLVLEVILPAAGIHVLRPAC